MDVTQTTPESGSCEEEDVEEDMSKVKIENEALQRVIIVTRPRGETPTPLPILA